MTDPTVVQKEPLEPGISPDPNPIVEPTEPTPTPPGEPNPEPTVPFHDDPKVQEYVDRQVDKKLREFQQYQQSQQPLPQPSVQVDPYKELEAEYVRDLKLTQDEARIMVDKIRKANTIANADNQKSMQAVQIYLRLNELVAQYPDAAKVQKEMNQDFMSMNPASRMNILADPEGMKSLYARTLLKKGNAPPINKFAGGSSRGGSVPQTGKIDTKTGVTNNAVSAGLKGDKKSYEESVQKIKESGGFKK